MKGRNYFNYKSIGLITLLVNLGFSVFKKTLDRLEFLYPVEEEYHQRSNFMGY